jgi:hypothetical protein
LSAAVIICIVSGIPYFTDAITTGTVRSGEYPFAIGVLPESDARIPIGIAFEVGITENGFAVWRLKVAGEQVPGRFIIENGLFVPVEPAREDECKEGVVPRWEQSSYRELVVTLASEPYHCEREEFAPSEKALVGTYLESLPDDGSADTYAETTLTESDSGRSARQLPK